MRDGIWRDVNDELPDSCDGVIVVVSYPNSFGGDPFLRVEIAWHTNEHETETSSDWRDRNDYEADDGVWDEEEGIYYLPAGWYTTSFATDRYYSCPYVSHWTPMPAFPRPQSRTGT